MDPADEQINLALRIAGGDHARALQVLDRVRLEYEVEKWIPALENAVMDVSYGRRLHAGFDEFVAVNLARMTDYASHTVDAERAALWAQRVREASDTFYDAGGFDTINSPLDWIYAVAPGEDGGLYRNTVKAMNDETLTREQREYAYREMSVKPKEGILARGAAEFAEQFARVASCVSKEDFEADVRTTAGMLAQLLAKRRTEDRQAVVLFLPAEINRSTPWMAMQMWGAIREHVDLIADEDTVLEGIRRASPGRLLWVFIDDAAYSGGQVLNRVAGIRDDPRDDVLVVVPFASPNAVDLWARHEIEVLVGAHPRMQDLGHMGPDFWGPMGEVSQWLAQRVAEGGPAFDSVWKLFKRGNTGTTFGGADSTANTASGYAVRPHLMSAVELDHIPTMFSHKLPDLISVPQHLFALAPYPVVDVERRIVTIHRMSLLEGCDTREYAYLYPPKHAYDMVDTDFDQGAGRVCPMPVYKQKAYLDARGEPIAPGMAIIDYLDGYW